MLTAVAQQQPRKDGVAAAAVLIEIELEKRADPRELERRRAAVFNRAQKRVVQVYAR